MSEEAHHEHDGGHELEAIHVGSLFKLILASAILVYASIVGVSQLFYKQRAGIIVSNTDYQFLGDHRAQEAKLLDGIDTTKTAVASDAKKLVAFPAPEGWVHPDDIAAGTTTPAAAAPGGSNAAATPAGAKPAATPQPAAAPAKQGMGQPAAGAKPAAATPGTTH